MILVIDNYDSFTYNLAQYLGELGETPRVFRNDAVTVPEIIEMAPDAIVISPGPCTPAEAGISTPAVASLLGRIPIFGVCLGHQCIAAACGAPVVRGRVPVHGKTSRILHDGRTIFEGLPSPLIGTRYHSLVVEEAGLPAALEVSARTEDGVIMGLRHREALLEGVQFHPESVLTEHGHAMLRNFLALARGGQLRDGASPLEERRAAASDAAGAVVASGSADYRVVGGR
ncbi:MAG TPA: aminodeoxychorismate/anthranilate synthase component II [bacterium]|nr:aminodeoxychorismate/anthranilate synthase component II [bacterium]